MNVLIVGKSGQLAYELWRSRPAQWNVIACSSAELDVTNVELVNSIIDKIQPQVVINCSAYTAVDKAEADVEQAYLVNECGAKHLADACKRIGARLLHVSTDFVFDGKSSTPYQVDDTPNPINVYGASKLAGEKSVQSLLPDTSVVVRTAWVYSANGNNFVKTMLKLMASRPQLGIVGDQIGTPTWAKGLAEWLWLVAKDAEVHGVFHWTDAGTASWYDFAVAIQELAISKGLLKAAIPIQPIPAVSYPTPAKRPSFSIIDKTLAERTVGIQTIHWRKQLSSMMDELIPLE